MEYFPKLLPVTLNALAFLRSSIENKIVYATTRSLSSSLGYVFAMDSEKVGKVQRKLVGYNGGMSGSIWTR